MWSGCVKASVGRAFPPRCCAKPSALLKTAQMRGHRRITSSTGELVEPDNKVLESLVCPFSKSPLAYDRNARELMSPVGVAYPITASGIPNMVPACARIVPANQEEE